MPPRIRGGGREAEEEAEGKEEDEEQAEEEGQTARAGRIKPVNARPPGWEELPVCSSDTSVAVNNCQEVSLYCH